MKAKASFVLTLLGRVAGLIPCTTVQHPPTTSQASNYPAKSATVTFQTFFIRQETFGNLLASTDSMR